MEIIEDCTHDDKVILSGGVDACSLCGLVFGSISDDPEWCTMEGKKRTRCSSTRVKERSIMDELQRYSLPMEVMIKADEYYKKIIASKTYRRSSRKGVIFVCTFQAYKSIGEPKDPRDLLKTFSITKKEISKGTKICAYLPSVDELAISETSSESDLSPTRDSSDEERYVEGIDLIPDLLDRFNIKKSEKRFIEAIYIRTIKRSDILNRSHPQSVAAGLLYYYLKLINMDVTKKEYASKTALSQITINKIAREFNRLEGTKISI